MASQKVMSAPWPPPSALTSFINANIAAASESEAQGPATNHLRALALQVQHQLIHQYDWTDVKLHSHTNSLGHVLQHWRSSNSTTSPPEDAGDALPRPLLTGTPPRPLYTHPDVQVALIKANKTEEDLPVEPVIVCPAHIREGGWSLERLSGVFDALPEAYRGWLGEVLSPGAEGGKGVEELDGKKRVLLAVVEDDSTVVFYWVHNGLVKPRQN